MRAGLVIGLTGGFATGKTTVANIFKKLGATIIDADKIAGNILTPGTKVYKNVVACFGDDILESNHSINRQKLAQIVFNDPNRLAQLNRITHPAIIDQLKKTIADRKPLDEIIIIDVPLLVEAGMMNMIDRLVVVEANQEIQIQRATARSEISPAQVRDRIAAQLPLEEKLKLADFVIDNNTSLQATEAQVIRIFEELRQLIS